ncbi:MAG: hypothetical protein HKO62_00610, partial [Gammaproteobacteria bacterium]|nr:hypothetical protein [Gammaproteobacteria bacterium]
MMKKLMQVSLGVVAATMFASTASAALVNGGFEDTPFVGAEQGVPIVGWSDYGANFRVQCIGPCSDPIGGPGAFEGTVALKNFGNSGVFQDFAASEGDIWAGSVQAMNPNNADQMVGGQIALAAIIWLDGGGGVI